MSDIEPTPFGDKYVLVEHIATGGMAEIYRANYSGIEGFAKELVIKELRAEFAARPKIVEMFLEEARVAATLTHNNVVHTYDLGQIADQQANADKFYIAMELLKGQELVAVLRRAAQIGEMVPLDIAIGIIMQSLEGLHYVHARKDDQGNPLGLVHRDINPTNIHVGYNGVCKILDFGIAATRATAVAKAGELAGKVSYMAPEQIGGQPLDARADIFALGVVLYEMCLGRRLFRGPKDDVMRRILEGDVPAPTFVDPEFPPELEAIIMKALEVDPAERYQNCDHMFRDLEAFTQEAGLAWTPRKISAHMDALFGQGVPAEVNYEDLYDDLKDDALDFADYERTLEDSTSQGDAPDWAKQLERSDRESGPRRRATMTIGNLEALVQAADESGQGAKASRSSGQQATTSGGRSGSGGRSRAASASGSGSRRRPATSGRHRPVRRTTGGNAADPRTTGSMSAVGKPGFGSGVVTEQTRRGSQTLVWLVGLLAIGGLIYFAYTMLTTK